MWAVVCMGIYDYTILSVNLFEDFDKAARFISSEAEKSYDEMCEYNDNISLSVDHSGGYAEIVINGEVEYIWGTDFVGDVCVDCED